MSEYGKPLKVVISAEKEEAPKQETKQLSKWQEMFEGFGDSLSSNFKGSVKDAGSMLGNATFKGLKAGADYLVDSIKKAWQEIGNMVNYSLLSDANTRELAFSYGMSGSEAYGFSKAKDLMGIKNDEDLYWLNSTQREMFSGYMNSYAEKYQELYDSGFFEEYMEFQYEWQNFRQEFLMQLVSLIMDNKDVIINFMEGGMEFMKFVTEALSTIASWFGGPQVGTESDRARQSADILNYDYRASTTTINMDNTYNNVSKADQSWLANVGEMTYEQIKQALRVNYS